MVTWGVVEFALHTLRPNTIQRENQIVSVFKEASDTIWETHKNLQLTASKLSNTLSNATDSNYLNTISQTTPDLDETSTDWLLIKDGKAEWWSDNLTLNVIRAMQDATSVLHSNDDGVFVIASSKWSANGSEWQLLGSTKVFDISVSGSRYGDVYEAAIPALLNMEPAPFYLEGSPDLLPFDHRFSIIRINDDYTTGHLALSTLDPGVRNYVNPLWIYGLRTLFFLIVAMIAWKIINLFVVDYSEILKLVSRLTFLIFIGWAAVLLDIIRYWSGLSTAETLFQESGLTIDLILFAWASFVFMILTRDLVIHFTQERFFDHGTRFNKTSLVLFIVGCFVGGLFWWILGYYSELSDLLGIQNLNDKPLEFRELTVGFLWFILIASTFKLLGGLLLFIQKSVKYQVSWILQILVTGHIYLYTILFILNYTPDESDLIRTGWVFMTLPIGIWILHKVVSSETSSDSFFIQSLKLSLFPCLVAFPLYLIESFNSVQFIQISSVLVGIWIKSFMSSMVVVSVVINHKVQDSKSLSLNIRSLSLGHYESRLLLTTSLLIAVYFLSVPIAQSFSKSQLEDSYSDFRINQSNQHPVAGSYEPGLLNLPVFKSWMVTTKPDFDELLNHQIYTSVLTNTSENILRWSEPDDTNAPLLKLYSLAKFQNTPENYQILATTVDAYSRIFGRLSAIISSLSILAVLSVHFGLGILGRRGRIRNVSTN